MSLFQCEWCGCICNTAIDCPKYRFSIPGGRQVAKKYIGINLCSVDGPKYYLDGTPTGYGKWHGVFPRKFFKKGSLKKTSDGGLVYKDGTPVNMKDGADEVIE